MLRAGRTKKVVVLSGPGDAGTVLSTEDSLYPSYAVSKAGINMAIAKYAVEYKREGMVFLSIDPGIVNATTGVGEFNSNTHHYSFINYKFLSKKMVLKVTTRFMQRS